MKCYLLYSESEEEVTQEDFCRTDILIVDLQKNQYIDKIPNEDESPETRAMIDKCHEAVVELQEEGDSK
ncbi:MAG: hypothetical protein ACUZ77_09285 [Candidatus Brocadiales bacterium]